MNSRIQATCPERSHADGNRQVNKAFEQEDIFPVSSLASSSLNLLVGDNRQGQQRRHTAFEVAKTHNRIKNRRSPQHMITSGKKLTSSY
jgi:hypothetical protein